MELARLDMVELMLVEAVGRTLDVTLADLVALREAEAVALARALDDPLAVRMVE